MKKFTLPQKMFFFFFLFTLITQHSSLNTLFSQVPQKFNYQAVARNGNEILVNQNINVQFDVLQGSSSGTSVWQETQNVTTNQMGLFTLEVGSVTLLNLDWTDGGPYFLNVKIDLQDGSGYKDFGNSELLSVPYALNAASVSSLKNLEIIEPLGYDPDSALFKVVNKDGDIVFAVYNEGVRVYVADLPTGKGSKGGFAIGGFTPGKGITNEYMRITPDSVRIYVDETVSKGSKGGFAIGGFTPGKGPVTDFLHLTPDNYFIGHMAGNSITSGLYNSFFGYDAGVMNTIGNSNVFIGNETGYGNVNGHWNIFIGNSVGYANTSGSANIFLGDEAGISNTIGSGNVFMGDLAGYSNTIGGSNVFIGADAGLSNNNGEYNVFLGAYSGLSNVSGTSNVFLGESTGTSNTLGNSNVFIGNESGYTNTTGNYNVFVGEVTGWSNTIGVENVCIGTNAGELNTIGSYNVFLGTLTGNENTTGIGNVFLGQETGQYNSTGSLNVAIGALSGNSNVIGNNNVFLGFSAGINETGSNRLYIDNTGADWDQALIYGEFDFQYLSFFADLDVAGTIYAADVVTSSDEKWKKNISAYENALQKVMRLESVYYNWRKEEFPNKKFSDKVQIGLIAQDLEKVIPELVHTTKKGDKGVNYSKLSVVLLEAIQEQQGIIEELMSRIETLERR